MSADARTAALFPAVHGWLTQISIEEVDPGRSLAGPDLDPVSQTEPIQALEDRLPVRLDAQDLENLKTFGDLSGRMARLRG